MIWNPHSRSRPYWNISLQFTRHTEGDESFKREEISTCATNETTILESLVKRIFEPAPDLSKWKHTGQNIQPKVSGLDLVAEDNSIPFSGPQQEYSNFFWEMMT